MVFIMNICLPLSNDLNFALSFVPLFVCNFIRYNNTSSLRKDYNEASPFMTICS